MFNPKKAADRAVHGFDGFQKISKKQDGEQYVFGQLLVKAAQEAGFEFNDDYNGSPKMESATLSSIPMRMGAD